VLTESQYPAGLVNHVEFINGFIESSQSVQVSYWLQARSKMSNSLLISYQTSLIQYWCLRVVCSLVELFVIALSRSLAIQS